MSSGEGRKVTLQDIQVVQNLIERCLQLYMSKREVVDTLSHQAKIEPAFTRLVWQKLEAENQEFFRAYYIRLILKNQIVRFNELLEKQVEMIHLMSQSGVSFTPLPHGSQMHSMERNSSHRDLPQPHGPCIKSENMSPIVPINDYTNRNHLLQQHVEVAAANMPGHAERMNFPTHTALLQNSYAGIVQGFNWRTIKTEGVYEGNLPVMFGADNTFLDAHNAAREVSISPFNGGESFSGSMLELELEMEKEMNSFGLEHDMTPNFSLSTDFSTNIMESYSGSGSPFMAMESNLLVLKQGKVSNRNPRRPEESFNYEGFGSN